MNPQLAIALLELALEKGVPAVIAIMQAWGKDAVTLEDIRELREGIAPPDEYFE